jgi:hypothetical protein
MGSSQQSSAPTSESKSGVSTVNTIAIRCREQGAPITMMDCSVQADAIERYYDKLRNYGQDS